MVNVHTIIGAKAFHFRIRNGNGWGHLAKSPKLSSACLLTEDRFGGFSYLITAYMH